MVQDIAGTVRLDFSLPLNFFLGFLSSGIDGSTGPSQVGWPQDAACGLCPISAFLVGEIGIIVPIAFQKNRWPSYGSPTARAMYEYQVLL